MIDLAGPPVDGRIPHYAHEDASVPIYWSRTVPVEELPPLVKVSTWLPVSSEALDDAEAMREWFLAELVAPRRLSWRERADRELYRFRPGFRLRCWWAGRRRALADLVDPDRE